MKIGTFRWSLVLGWFLILFGVLLSVGVVLAMGLHCYAVVYIPHRPVFRGTPSQVAFSGFLFFVAGCFCLMSGRLFLKKLVKRPLLYLLTAYGIGVAAAICSGERF